eukprot:3132369-Rhodomonas_salina.1
MHTQPSARAAFHVRELRLRDGLVAHHATLLLGLGRRHRGSGRVDCRAPRTQFPHGRQANFWPLPGS